MTVTYNGGLTLARDRLRFQLGDTDTSNALLTDEEIAGAVTLQSTEDAALLYLAKGLLRRWAREPVRVSADGTTFDWSGRLEVWREIIADAASVSTGGLRIRKLSRPQLIDDQGEYST